MRRGEVWWVDFGTGVGGEIEKARPAIILSDDAVIRSANRVQVVPLTSNVRRLFTTEAFVDVAGRRSKAVADQIRTVAKQRVQRRFGVLSAGDLAAVEDAIRRTLSL